MCLKKAFPISFSYLCEIFKQTLGDSTLESLSFVNLRFITFILTFYEEVSILKISDVQKEGPWFIFNFFKGKSYQYGESHIGVIFKTCQGYCSTLQGFFLYIWIE